jgi:hypothetical protein
MPTCITTRANLNPAAHSGITTYANLDAAGRLGQLMFQIAALEEASMFRPAPHVKRTIVVERAGEFEHLDYDEADELAETLMDAKNELISTLSNSPMRHDRSTMWTCITAILDHYGDYGTRHTA